MKSTKQKIAQCAGLIGTKDITPWEDQFLRDVQERTPTDGIHELSEKQMAVLDRIHSKHFA